MAYGTIASLCDVQYSDERFTMPINSVEQTESAVARIL